MAGAHPQLLIARVTALVAAALVAALPVAAEWQPTKPVKIVVPFAPGGQSDIVMRFLAGPLAAALGQPVLIENRPGAGGNIAAEAVARSVADGHTLLIGTNGPLALATVLSRDLAYDPLRDLAPVTLLGTSPSLIAVRPSLGVATLEALVEKARAAPDRLNFGSVGTGSVSHLSIELLNVAAGIRTVHVPYTGSAPAVAALLAGDVHILSLNPSALVPQMNAGRVRILAQTSLERSPLLPGIPTVAEAGYPELEALLWMAVMAPANTPPQAIERLNAEFVRLAREPALKTSLWDRQWIDPVGSTPAEVTSLMRRERDQWARTVKSAGIE